VLLLHGGGQTRHAWRNTAERIARAGMTAYALDQRGHGDSDWVADGTYTFFDFAADVRLVSETLSERVGSPPVAIGASLGGIASLLAYGGANLARRSLRRWCWWTSRRGSTWEVLKKSKGSCASTRGGDFPLCRKRLTWLQRICHIGRDRVRRKG
jgi:predicted alpha/beta hydrolase